MTRGVSLANELMVGDLTESLSQGSRVKGSSADGTGRMDGRVHGASLLESPLLRPLVLQFHSSGSLRPQGRTVPVFIPIVCPPATDRLRQLSFITNPAHMCLPASDGGTHLPLK